MNIRIQMVKAKWGTSKTFNYGILKDFFKHKDLVLHVSQKPYGNFCRKKKTKKPQTQTCGSNSLHDLVDLVQKWKRRVDFLRN